jgi:phosphate starvation-inducible PhoH-like protein
MMAMREKALAITFDRSKIADGARRRGSSANTGGPLSEHILRITAADPMVVLGPNDQNLRIIREHFPKLNLVARGEELKVIGPAGQVDLFLERFEQLQQHAGKYNELPRKVLDDILGGGKDGEAEEGSPGEGGVIVHGNAGLRVKARTPNQQRMVDAVSGNDMVFAVGPAGTGKTYTAVALAVRALKERSVRRIVLTRPAVEAGENLGFLPGDLREKLDPYLQPLYDALRDMVPPGKLDEYLGSGVVQIAPLAFMRGRTLDHAFVILDEAQNATLPQLKMFLTRMGRDAKFIITGDATQVDLPERVRSGLLPAVDHLRGVQGVAVVDLDEKDVIRHELVVRVIAAFKEIEENRPPAQGRKKNESPKGGMP